MAEKHSVSEKCFYKGQYAERGIIMADEKKKKLNILGRIKYNAPVTLTFALISLGALLLSIATDGKTNITFFSTYRDKLTHPLMYLRLFTHVLGHANWAHYSGNMMFILILGPILEEKYGSRNLLEMICITAFITGVINNIFFPDVRLLGASGIVFMFIILASAVSFKAGEIPITLILVFVIYVGQEIATGITSKDNISQLGHIIGGICGGLYGLFYANDSKAKKDK